MIRINLFIGFLITIFFCTPQAKAFQPVATPYGEFQFTDDDASCRLLQWFSESTRRFEVDSINTCVIIGVSDISDGALSEIIGCVCIDDLLNKHNVIALIYKYRGYDFMKMYLTHIGWELAIRQQCSDGKKDEFNTFKNKLIASANDADTMPYLMKILDHIKEVYDREKDTN